MKAHLQHAISMNSPFFKKGVWSNASCRLVSIHWIKRCIIMAQMASRFMLSRDLIADSLNSVRAQYFMHWCLPGFVIKICRDPYINGEMNVLPYGLWGTIAAGLTRCVILSESSAFEALGRKMAVTWWVKKLQRPWAAFLSGAGACVACIR